MINSFEVDILGSGSKGNSTLIKAGNTAILIDAGLTCKRIVEGIRACDLEPEDLSGILITHEHSDHIAGLAVLSRTIPHVPIFANEKTWGQMALRKSLTNDQRKVLPRGCVLGNIRVESFKVPHDAADTVGYKLFYKNDKCTYLTDCGYITKECELAAEGSNTMILEANHDEMLLRNGSYPKFLQDRIAGVGGHLSNTTAGNFLRDLDNRPVEVFLAHLSEKNNTEPMAFTTVRNILTNAHEEKNIKIYIANQHKLVSNKK